MDLDGFQREAGVITEDLLHRPGETLVSSGIGVFFI